VPFDPLETVYRYHDGTKHHFHAFARSLGYLDWASQPNPFREYSGAPSFRLYPSPHVKADDYTPLPISYDALFAAPSRSQPISAAAIGDLLRHALGLSAWKQYGRSRWSLRVNPSSGNLHPTEAYVICGAVHGLADTPAVYHYAPDRHALEQRCAFEPKVWSELAESAVECFFVALTSIHWREAWKYGERAFRYCQHDLGHAIAAISLASALCGWRCRIVPSTSSAAIASLTGIDREEDFFEAEREEPGCLLRISVGSRGSREHLDHLERSVQAGRWMGKANQLSEDHVQWTFIDEVAAATRSVSSAGRAGEAGEAGGAGGAGKIGTTEAGVAGKAGRHARTIILTRRSALGFDGVSTLARESFLRMMSSVMPAAGAPWDSIWWTPRIHFLLFVHRVDGMAAGLYLLVRDASAMASLREAAGREFGWEAVAGAPALFCLARGDCRTLARRLSCDQDIASDGFFSLGMIADFERSLREDGPSFYRNLFWESGAVGQVLYLEAEAAGVRSTGIGCFYDDPVHSVLGLRGHAFQSLYHFTVGMPVEDTRLTTEPGYPDF
jgi:SagB-type dehydrogenase family enzyme